MFGLFGKKRSDRDGSHEEGRRLFEAGVAMASQFRCQEAIDLYSRSIQVCANPAPYINRANLLGKRMRHFEALQDLLAAQRVDVAREFSQQIRRELEQENALAGFYRNGTRERLIEDLRKNGHQFVASRVFAEWPCGEHAPLLEYHFFNELDNIAKFEKPGDYPQAEGWIRKYSTQVVLKKIESCPDPKGYFGAESMLRMFLCVYEMSDMRLIRGFFLSETHAKLGQPD